MKAGDTRSVEPDGESACVAMVDEDIKGASGTLGIRAGGIDGDGVTRFRTTSVGRSNERQPSEPDVMHLHHRTTGRIRAVSYQEAIHVPGGSGLRDCGTPQAIKDEVRVSD